MTSTVTSDPKPQQEGDAVVRPKRPLSAYNLFYRFKRAQLLAAAKGGRDNSPDAVRRLVAALPGLEDIPSVDLSTLTSEELGKVNEVRGNAIRGALKDMLTPKDTSKRSHRKGEAIAGALSFLEMSRIMSASWKDVDDFARKIFEELADEGRALYHQKVTQYQERRASLGLDAEPPKEVKAKAPKKAAKNAGKRKKEAEEKEEERPDSPKSAKGEDVPLEKPKRPLSCYNLFYRFKRDHLLRALERGDDNPATIARLVSAAPGLEDGLPPDLGAMSPKELNELRRTNIRSVLLANLLPKDHGRRSHRRSHGALGFLEMGRIMCAAWKAIDDYARGVFEEMAEEGRATYVEKVKAYEAKMGKKVSEDGAVPPPAKKAKLDLESMVDALIQEGKTAPSPVEDVVPVAPMSTKIPAQALWDHVAAMTPKTSNVSLLPFNVGMPGFNVPLPPFAMPQGMSQNVGIVDATPAMATLGLPTNMVPPQPVFAVSPVSQLDLSEVTFDPTKFSGMEPLPAFLDVHPAEEALRSIQDIEFLEAHRAKFAMTDMGCLQDACDASWVSDHSGTDRDILAPHSVHAPLCRAGSNGSEASAEDFMRLVDTLDL